MWIISKSHCDFFFIFLQSTHQVDMKNIVKCYKHFFWYFNALETHSERADYVHHITTCSSWFPDFPTALHWWCTSLLSLGFDAAIKTCFSNRVIKTVSRLIVILTSTKETKKKSFCSNTYTKIGSLFRSPIPKLFFTCKHCNPVQGQYRARTGFSLLRKTYRALQGWVCSASILIP